MDAVMDVLQWVLEHIEEIALLGALVVTIIDGGLKKARAVAVSLMLEAEKVAQHEVELSGPEKMQRVLSDLVDRLPVNVKAVLRALATLRGQSLEDTIADLAQRWYDAAVNA